MNQKFSPNEVIEILNGGTESEVDKVTAYLYRTYKPKVASYIFLQHGTYEEAKDIFQEVIITFLHQVWEKKFKAMSEKEMEGYFKGIAHHKWLKKKEADGRRRRREDTFLNEGHEESNAPPLERLLQKEDKQIAWQIFQKLDEICQKILIAFYVDGYSLEEIALRYELGSAEAVKLRKFRCVRKLREMLLP
ncbi:RNA polymerase sigma factor, sigma-70 family [Pseudarcicella hirudinis]|uniref:RNA polymerase sigma factor, sigma-70 family n=1 Tax=Pseudarcicella hirudinis TaxID=1079859 RepID=A0A1I5M948_9BACT|nr:sigma-70 family RNA polymerase sigma factor [Pseudarcicella hirudinis]SFP05456.1 RNA polymerase sigma factor, sigma-70 family [Pseudarcicella hirudinis]